MSAKLSKREKEVVNMLLEGNSNKLIALAMGISDRTVEFHLRNIYTKYNVSSRLELVLQLENQPGKENSKNPGISTVDDPEENSENGNRLNTWKDWAIYFKDTVVNNGKEFLMDNSTSVNKLETKNPLTFFESIRVCFTKYADFQGNASRSEIWWFLLFVTLVISALMYLGEVVASIFLIAVLLPLLAVGSRRLHDVGKSAWWLLFLLAPIGGLVILGFLWSMPPAIPFTDKSLQK